MAAFNDIIQRISSGRNFCVRFLVLSLIQTDYEEVHTYLNCVGVLSYKCAGY